MLLIYSYIENRHRLSVLCWSNVFVLILLVKYSLKNKEVSYRSNRVSTKVRVPNIRATNVLRCSNAPDLKADSESVRISEISQQMPEIPTFFCQSGLNWVEISKKKLISIHIGHCQIAGKKKK